MVKLQVNKSLTPIANLLRLVNYVNKSQLKDTDVEFLWPYNPGGALNTMITVNPLSTSRYEGQMTCSYNRLVLSENPLLLTGYIVRVPKSATLDEIKKTVLDTFGWVESDILFYYAALPTWGATGWAIGCPWNSLIYTGSVTVTVQYKS